MSFDPVAHDTVGLSMFREALDADDNYPIMPSLALASNFLQNSADLGLGTDNPDEVVWSRLALD